MKYACEESAKQGAKTYFLGPEFDQITWERLLHETRTTVFSYIHKHMLYWGHHHWHSERKDFLNRLHNSEPSQFTEKCADPYLINWVI